MKQQEEVYTDSFNPLDSIKDILADDIKSVNNLIKKNIASKVGLIPELSDHIFASGGKRLRPLLTLACAKLSGYEGQAHIDLATSVEFIHTATLLHDDVVDGSKLRRGENTANRIWGNKETILVGDFLFAKAFELMGKAKSVEIFKTLAQASVIISEGEVFQLTKADNIANFKSSYLKIIKAKTAELFAAACQVGPILASRPAAEIEAFRNFGLNLGIAFQIVDDALDYSSNQESFGKKIGNDFLEGKITLPVIICYNESSAVEKDFWQRTLVQGHVKDNDLSFAIEFMNRHDAVSKSLKVAKNYIKPAKEQLNMFADCEIKSSLLDILDFTVKRQS